MADQFTEDQFNASDVFSPLDRIDEEYERQLYSRAEAANPNVAADRQFVASRSAVQPAESQLSLTRQVKNIAAGGLGTIGSILSGARWAERFVGMDTAAGRTAEEWGKSIQAKVQELSPADPGFIDNLFQGVGSMATFMIPGLGTTAGAARLATAAPWLARVLGLGVATILEASSEAGDSYQSLQAEGKTEAEARTAAARVFAENTVLIAATNHLGIFGKNASALVKGAKSALMEGLQESVQYGIQNVESSQPFSVGSAVQAGVIGAVLGGATGAIESRIEKPGSPAVPTEPSAPAPARIEPPAQTLGPSPFAEDAFTARDFTLRVDPNTGAIQDIPTEGESPTFRTIEISMTPQGAIEMTQEPVRGLISARDQYAATLRNLTRPERAQPLGTMPLSSEGKPISWEEIVHKEATDLVNTKAVTIETIAAYTGGTTLTDAQHIAVGQVLLQQREKLVEAAKAAKKEGTTEAAERFIQAFIVMGKLDAHRLALSAEAGYSLRAQEEITKAIRDLSALMADATSGVTVPTLVDRVLSLKDTPGPLLSLANQVVNSKGSKIVKGLETYYINSLLSGPQTQLVNVGSNVLFAHEQMFMTEAVGQTVGRVQEAIGNTPGAVPGQGMAELHGYYASARDAFRIASDRWKGVNSAELAKLTESEKLELDRKFNEQFKILTNTEALNTNVLAKAFDYLMTLPGRALSTADVFSRHMSERAVLQGLVFREAYLEAARENITDPAKRATFIHDRSESLLNSPPNWMLEHANLEASKRVFQEKLGPIGQGIQQIIRSVPGGKFLIPFMQTPANLAREAFRRVPLLNLTSRELWNDFNSASPIKRDKAIGLVSFSMVFGGVLANAALNGILTGAAPRDKELRQQWEAAGWKEYSIDFGRLLPESFGGRAADQPPRPGDLISFGRVDPFGMVLAFWADLAHASGHIAEGDFDAFLSEAAAIPSNVFISKTWVAGAADFLSMLSDPVRGAKAWAARTVTGFVPAAAKQLFRPADVKMVDGFFDRIQSQVPGWASSLPPSRDLFGNKQMIGGGYGDTLEGNLLTGLGQALWRMMPFYINTASQEHQALFKTMQDNQINAPDVPKTLQGIALSATQRDLLSQLAGGKEVLLNGSPIQIRLFGGKTMPEALAEVMSPDNLNWARQGPGVNGGRAALVDRIVRHYYSAASQLLLASDETLSGSVRDLVLMKREGFGSVGRVRKPAATFGVQ